VQAIVDAVEGFRGDRPQADDMTVVVVKIGGQPG
jgi:serine phosphatase RsbU (regulator of sigma subunit)